MSDILFNYSNNYFKIKDNYKIAAFDLDHTLIKPKNNKIHPKDENDWEFQYDNVKETLHKLYQKKYHIIIFSNQGGKTDKIKKIDIKIKNVIEKLNIPIDYIFSLEYNNKRKPMTGMWEHFIDYYKINNVSKESFYCGDAAGRDEGYIKDKKKDFANSDRLFSYNIGLKFYVPEELFLNYLPPLFFDRCYNLYNKLLLYYNSELFNKKIDNFTLTINNDQNIIVLTGAPASGKSMFSKIYFKKLGYEIINQDLLKTKSKVIKEIKKKLELGNSIVVDNTNPDVNSRKIYIDLANQFNIKINSFYFRTEISLCKLLNYYRGQKSNKFIPDIDYNIYKKKFVNPTLKEGFYKIYEIPFLLNFCIMDHKILQMKFI